MDGLLVLLSHVVRVTQIVERRIMLGIKSNSLEVELDGFHKLTLVAIGIS